MAKQTRKALRKQVAENAKYCCEYCYSQETFSPDSFSIEHIIPASKNGTDQPENLAFACQGCNSRKYNHTEAIDPVTNKTSRLFHPRKDNWQDHFQWNIDQTKIIGLSPIGRATIERLGMNRAGITNLRTLLIPFGLHPPK